MLCSDSESTVYLHVCIHRQCYVHQFHHHHFQLEASVECTIHICNTHRVSASPRSRQKKNLLLSFMLTPCRRWRRNTNSVSTIKLSQLTSRPMSPTCWLRTKSSKTDCLKFKYVLRKKGGGALHDSKQQGLAYSTAIKVKTSTNNTTSC